MISNFILVYLNMLVSLFRFKTSSQRHIIGINQAFCFFYLKLDKHSCLSKLGYCFRISIGRLIQFRLDKDLM